MVSLEELLEEVLPKNENFKLAHLQTTPTETDPIVTPEYENYFSQIMTIETEHFFTMSYHNKIFYALEIMVYITIDKVKKTSERTIFISKTDTNGYCDMKVNIRLITTAIMRYLLLLDPTYYLQDFKAKKNLSGTSPVLSKEYKSPYSHDTISEKITSSQHSEIPDDGTQFKSEDCKYFPILSKICLFTRSEQQYLFPDSSQNPKKHVMSGVRLLKWWLSIMDCLACEEFLECYGAKLQIPGEKIQVIENYIKTTRFNNWKIGDVFSDNSNDIAIYRIPMFPDDPKGRFLEDLVEENRFLKVNVSKFWIELQARQEFRLNELVSIIGIKGISLSKIEKPSSKEVVISKSEKEFKEWKNYVIGEGYDTEDNALVSHSNIYNALSRSTDHPMININGKLGSCDNINRLVNDTGLSLKRDSANYLNNSIVRKKPKTK